MKGGWGRLGEKQKLEQKDALVVRNSFENRVTPNLGQMENDILSLRNIWKKLCAFSLKRRGENERRRR
jgi:hypothetical protein